PEATLTYLLIFLLLGFPLYIYLLWKYQLKDKIKRKPLLAKSGIPLEGKFKKSSFQKIYFSSLSIIGIIAIGVTLVVIDKKFVRNVSLLEMTSGDKIAVLEFDNDTGNKKFDINGKMASDWIIHGISQNKLGQVISREIIDEYSKILRASILAPDEKNTSVTDYLKPSKIISGEYYLHNNRLLFQCSITDEIMNTTLIAFEPVECDPSSPLDCIEALKQRILGYLVTEDKKIASLEDSPPSFEAYGLFNQAKSKYLEDPYDPETLQLVEKAIAADSSYFEPKVYKFQYYFNSGELVVADSLLRPLLQSPRTSERQKILIRIYEALLDRKYNEAHRFQQIEYNISPFDLQTNSNMMIHSLQLVNKPQEIDSVFQEISMEEMDITKCKFCVERYKIKGMADIERKRYGDAITLLKDFATKDDFLVLKKVLLRAYIRAGKYDLADDVLSKLQLPSGQAEWLDVHLSAAKDFIWADKKDLANIHLDKIIDPIDDELKSVPNDLIYLYAESFFYRGEYNDSIILLEKLLETYPGLIDYHALLAIAYQKAGKSKMADQQLAELENLRADFQLGEVDYGLAQYYSSISDHENTIKYLWQAIYDGHWYETWTFQNDPLLTHYFETEDFKRILTKWH
ncbi:MAG: tetratricopeptide repeat protein, partial [Flavobacteriaceae bacterium]